LKHVCNFVGIEKFLGNIEETPQNTRAYICCICLKKSTNKLFQQKVFKHGRKPEIGMKEEVVKEGILKTKKYHLFSIMDGNRPIDDKHVENIVASILEKNLLHINPIVVNEDYEIIDGQHRFTAAKILETFIYYIVEPGLRLTDVQQINTNMKNWNYNDYINSHAIKGNKEFIKLKTFFDKYKKKIQISTALILLFRGNTNGKTMDYSIKKGDITFKDEDIKFAEDLLSLVEFIFFSTKINQVYSRSFLTALLRLKTESKFEDEIFKKKLEFQAGKIKPGMNKQEYIGLLLDIYNFRNFNPLNIKGFKQY
jgi:hypothetical protein